MKKFIFIFAAALAANFINAQLKVDSLGFVSARKAINIGKDTVGDYDVSLKISRNAGFNLTYGIHSTLSNSLLTNSLFSIVGHVINPYGADASANNIRNVGVLGVCENIHANSSWFSAGVVGVGNRGNSIGVYGRYTNNHMLLYPSFVPANSLGGAFAGYFDGNVKVTGALTANTVTETSDERLKENISALPKDVSDGLLDLKPISFKYTKDSLYYWYDDDAEPMTHTHYGLVAQEVKEVFPDLVYEDGNGYLSVNYIEIIPLLINTIKQQDAKLEQQDERIAELEKSALPQAQRAKAAAKNTNVQDNVSEAMLLQNTPNPFSEATVIGYSLPDDVADAAIYVYDMQGTQLQKHELTQRGCGTLTISGGTLRAGMYLYSLIADGSLIDTKRMILTE